MTAILCDGDGHAICYGTLAQNSESGTATLAVPSDLAIGNYTLKVFSEQRSGDYKTDYASELQDIKLEVTLPQAPTPQAIFAATGEDSGTLSNVEPGMKYSIDGGTEWKDVAGTSIDLSSVTETNDVKVYKPGDGTTTVDSAIQTIDLLKEDAPKVNGVDCATPQQNDGRITGVDDTMEYKLVTATEWKDVTGTVVTGLTSGTYEVRVKASGTMLTSEATTVAIGEHVCAPQDHWSSDANGHWNSCTCGKKFNYAAHAFEWVGNGEAAEANAESQREVCRVCGYVKALESDVIPQTGDSNHVLLLTMMFVASASLSAAAVSRRFVRKHNRRH